MQPRHPVGRHRHFPQPKLPAARVPQPVCDGLQLLPPGHSAGSSGEARTRLRRRLAAGLPPGLAAGLVRGRFTGASPERKRETSAFERNRFPHGAIKYRSLVPALAPPVLTFVTVLQPSGSWPGLVPIARTLAAGGLANGSHGSNLWRILWGACLIG